MVAKEILILVISITVCTMKCLIAITPSGGTCFMSDLFEGSIDDVKISEQSGILNHINPGDSLRDLPFKSYFYPDKLQYSFHHFLVIVINSRSRRKKFC